MHRSWILLLLLSACQTAPPSVDPPPEAAKQTKQPSPVVAVDRPPTPEEIVAVATATSRSAGKPALLLFTGKSW